MMRHDATPAFWAGRYSGNLEIRNDMPGFCHRAGSTAKRTSSVPAIDRAAFSAVKASVRATGSRSSVGGRSRPRDAALARRAERTVGTFVVS
jgi:hypothetical protein